MMSEKKVPAIRFRGFEDDWEQRKLAELVTRYEDPVETPHDGYIRLGIRSHAKGTFHEYVEPGHELETAQMHRVAANKLIFNITFAWEHAVAITTEDDAGKLVSHRFPQFSLSELLRPEFLKYVILDEGFHHKLYLASPGGAGRNRVLKVDEALDYPIFFPSVEEQHKIGEFLNQLNDLITLHQRKLEKLKIVKKTMLVNCFPKNGEKVPKFRFSGFTGDWEQRKLGDIVERITRKNENFESILPLTISAQYGLIDQNEFFDKRIASKDVSGYYLVRKGEFAYNKSTSSDAPWGAIKRLDRYESGVLSTLYIVFRILDEEKIDSDYLVTYYDTDLWHKGVQAIAAEGARNHGLLNIAPADFFETTVLMPQDIEEQRKIGAYFKNLDCLITLHQRELKKLQMIKKSMLRSMFV